MFTATRQFTDRTEPQTAFRNAYVDLANNMPGSNSSRVITYYGMGGMGKTRLLLQLKKNLSQESVCTEKNNKNPLVVYFDFEECQEDIQILTRLRNILNRDYHWQFPRFELGLYLYSKTIGEEIEAPTAKPVAEQKPLLKLFVDIASEIPLVGPVFKVLNYVDQGQAVLRNLRKQHADIAKKFEELSPAEQHNALPGLFAADLNAYTEKATSPLVILLDTHERIAESISQGSALLQDLWLYGEDRLIPMTKNTLWVIAGRHKIQWEAQDCPMEQHLLGSLSNQDAGSFLTAAGLPQHLIPDLCRLTDGTPLYLDVCVDQYEQLLRHGETPDLAKFGNGDTGRLIKCYLKYMDKSVKELVYMLTFITQWDERLVRSAAAQVLGSFSLADFKRVKKLSITLPVDQTHYFIHRTVADVLQKDPDNDSRESTAQFLIDHFSKVLETASPYTEEYSSALTHIMHGGLLLHQDRTALADFYRGNMEKQLSLLHRCHRYDITKKIFAPYWDRAAENPSDFLYAAALSEKAWHSFMRKEGKSTPGAANILNWTMEALRLLQTLNVEDHIEVPRTLEALAVYSDHLLTNYSQAVSLYQYVIHLCETKHPDEPDVLMNTKRNLAITHTAKKNFTAAEALFREILSEAESQYEIGDPRRLQAMQDMAGNCRNQRNYDMALELGKQVLQLATVHLKENHPYTINAMVGLASTYYQMGNYEEETKLCEKILKTRRKYLPKDHPDITAAAASLASTYLMLKDYQKELPLREEILERICKEYGEEHSHTLIAVEGLAAAYQNLSLEEKLSNLCKHWCNRWVNGGRETPVFAEKLADFVFTKLKNYPLATQLYEIVVNAPNPGDSLYLAGVVLRYLRLAECYHLSGHHEKALEILEEALDTKAKNDTEKTRILSAQVEILRETGSQDRMEQTMQALSEQERSYTETHRLSKEEAASKPRPVPIPVQAYRPPAPKPLPEPESFVGLSLQEVIDKIHVPPRSMPVRPKPAHEKSLAELMNMIRQQQKESSAQSQTPT